MAAMGMLVSGCLSAQTGRDATVRRFLSAAVELGACSPSGAECIARHLDDHGWPIAVEEAWQIQGLTRAETTWLIQSEEWAKWVSFALSRRSNANEEMRLVATRERRYFQDTIGVRQELSGRLGRARGRLTWAEEFTFGGSWTWSRNRWTVAVGDHAVGWGHGLTIPRIQSFGLAMFVGGSEVMLPWAPRGLDQTATEGALRGLAVQHTTTNAHVVLTCGRHHVGMVWARQLGQGEWGVSGHWEGGEAMLGTECSWKRRTLDGQLAMATSTEGTKRWRASLRWAQTSEWVAQFVGDTEWQGSVWSCRASGFVTWLDRNSGGWVQMRIRRQARKDWDARVKGRVGKSTPWFWGFRGSLDQAVAELSRVEEHLRLSWWWGRNSAGQPIQSRQVEWRYKSPSAWSAGFLGMDGQGVQDAYVMVPSLDLRRWSEMPQSGRRMGVWFARHKGKSGWTCQLTWAPAAKETFRWAWRWRWEQ